jgi:hypothetical protein
MVAPLSLERTAILGGCASAVWHPLAQLLIHLLWGEPLPFATPSEWIRFTVISGWLGVATGVATYHANRMRAGWLRDYATGCCTALGLVWMLQANRFAPDQLVWWGGVLFTTAFMGVVYAALARLFRRFSPPTKPLSSGGDSPAAGTSDPR